MINYLMIYVSISNREQEHLSALQKITDFIEHLVCSDIFDKRSDRFVIYLEDLYFVSSCPSTSKFLASKLAQFSRRLDVKIDVVENRIRKKITDFISSSYQSKSVSSYRRNIIKHLELFYKIAQIAIAPTLIKELIQQFGLHFETVSTKHTTVYHDLDMRYDINAFTNSNIRQWYINRKKAAIPALSSHISSIDTDFDVFWGVNVNDKNHVFLDAFFNTLYFTITHTYWKRGILSTDEERSLKSEILNTQINFYGSFVPDQDKPDNGLEDFILNHSIEDRLSMLVKEEESAIFALHYGRRHISPFRPPEFYNTPNSTRGELLACLFAASYSIPFRNYYKLNFSFVHADFQKRQTNRIFWSICMSKAEQANPQNGLCVFRLTEAKTTPDVWPIMNYTCDGLYLNKTMGGLWTRIPFLYKIDISWIFDFYPFMKKVLRLTAPLREFAKRPNVREEVWDTEDFLISVSQTENLVIENLYLL